MATNWNQLKSYRDSRDQTLADTPIESAPDDATVLEVVPVIQPTAEEFIPEWRIEGVSPVTADATSGKAPAPTPTPPLWESRDRPEGFPSKYQNLDPTLDSIFISSKGLTLSPGTEDDPIYIALEEA